MPWTVHVNVAEYGGIYSLRIVAAADEIATNVRGSQSFVLEANRYQISPSHGANFVFALDAEGKLSSETAGLICTGDTVRFNTTRIHVVPRDYKGTYTIGGYHHDQAVSGSNWFVVLRGGLADQHSDTGYSLILAPSNGFRFAVDSDGNVSLNQNYIRAARGLGHSLLFEHCKINVEPVNYTGQWGIRGVETGARSGARSVLLIPQVPGYILDVAPGKNARFDVDGNDTPTPLVNVSDGPNTWQFRLTKEKGND